MIRRRVFKAQMARALRAGPLGEVADVEIAVALARLVHDQLELHGTGEGHDMDDADMRETLLGLNAVLGRLGVEPLSLPFQDFDGFYRHWKREGASNSYRARRNMLDGLFGSLHDQLEDLETRVLAGGLVTAISPRGRTGWTQVDAEIAELRRHFAAAHTAQDYRNVGNDSVIVIETLARVVYDPDKHVRPGETPLTVNQTKLRLERFIEDAAQGPGNAELRKLARSTIDFAQAIKHDASTNRRDAGIIADAVIMLANLLRRLVEPA